jgi:hypothetical protein
MYRSKVTFPLVYPLIVVSDHPANAESCSRDSERYLKIFGSSFSGEWLLSPVSEYAFNDSTSMEGYSASSRLHKQIVRASQFSLSGNRSSSSTCRNFFEARRDCENFLRWLDNLSVFSLLTSRAEPRDGTAHTGLVPRLR